MISNPIPAQPKTPEETQEQFNEVCKYFGIEEALSGKEKLARLREIETGDLVGCIMKLKHHTFRPVTDGLLIFPGMIKYHEDGSFAEAFQDRGLKLLIGEMLNEESLYGFTNAMLLIPLLFLISKSIALLFLFQTKLM
jgi:carboxylesterase type B